MNLADHRQGLIDQSDWDLSASPDGLAMFDRFINRALNQVALDAPFLFFESRVSIATQPDVEPLIDEEVLTIPATDNSPSLDPNPWVFHLGANRGTAGMNDWPVDRAWDGRFLEITDADGRKHERRIRHIWEERLLPNDPGDIRLTIWEPWNIDEWGRGPYSDWRIYTKAYFVPDNVIEIRSARVIHEDRPYPLKVVVQGEAEALGLAEHSTTQPEGIPTLAFRSRHEQMRGPAQAPLINAEMISETAPWDGPEPQGQFRYVATYCWGKRPPDGQNPGPALWSGGADPWQDNDGPVGNSAEAQARLRFQEPLFESAPSPVSELATVTPVVAGGVLTSPGSAVYVYLPNIEYALGFMLHVSTDAVADYQRIHSLHSGWYVRIYRQRVSYDTTTGYPLMGGAPGTGDNVSALHHMDYDDAYYLLAEMSLDTTNEGVFVDNGSIIPDYHRRLRDINGYMGLHLWPHPDARYVLDLRAVLRPEKLISPQDVSPIHAEAADLVTQRAMVYLYEKLHDSAGRAEALELYRQQLGQLKRRYGTGVPDDQVIQVHPTRYPPQFSAQRWRV